MSVVDSVEKQLQPATTVVTEPIGEDNVTDSQCVRAAEAAEAMVQEETEMLADLKSMIPQELLEELTQPASQPTSPQFELSQISSSSSSLSSSSASSTSSSDLSIPVLEYPSTQRSIFEQYDPEEFLALFGPFPPQSCTFATPAKTETDTGNGNGDKETILLRAPRRKATRGKHLIKLNDTMDQIREANNLRFESLERKFRTDNFPQPDILAEIREAYVNRFNPTSQKRLDDAEFMLKCLKRDAMVDEKEPLKDITPENQYQATLADLLPSCKNCNKHTCPLQLKPPKKEVEQKKKRTIFDVNLPPTVRNFVDHI